ncbi:carotenoid biosynthesis protein [Deinococcus wulumuqiensis]|uniref:Carotenoid biosynthesis protein n=1 Tax=Deinococcus wulumuqiensis TaxID=980427 RepID=A0A345IIZ4_9DEIO|nr:carotenoid biosynthesis protein [Deinococcus wulumuqiensis]AXG99666.1 carotenoid biosynthesis protein [Deinococcus wulumuqiensis]
MIPPQLLRWGLAFAALGLAFLGALLVIRGGDFGWRLIALGLPLSGVFALAGDALGGDFSGTLAKRWRGLVTHTAPWLWWLALSVALKIPVPLWPEGFSLLGLLSTGALFASALTFAAGRVGWARAGAMALFACLTGLGVEVLGSQTGIPFGQYSYATSPPPTIFTVPLIVPLGWFAFTLAGLLLSGGRPWLAGLLIMLWDVGLEPLMTAQRYWLWSDPQPLWAGAPLQNFLGWWAVGTAIAWGMKRLAPGLFDAKEKQKAEGFSPSFSLAYFTEAFFLPGGLVLVGRLKEAAVTLAAMMLGALLARAVRRGR